MIWSKKELNFLKKNYPYVDDEILIRKLNRSIHAIKAKAKLCKKAKQWRLNNKEYRRKIGKLWRLRNKERKKAVDREYYQKIKKSKPDPICITCEKILVGKNHHTKWCDICSKKHRYEYNKAYRKKHIEHFRELGRKYNKKAREKENQIRKKLGLPLIGNYFRKEQELLFYINKLFINKKIIYHDRATLGNGWELDIFIPVLKLAFEYHGRQHFDFKSTGYWKTYKEFKDQQLRDKLKKVLCRIKGITLIEFTCYDKLNGQLVLSKLTEYKINTNQSNLIISDSKLKLGGN